MSYSSDIAHLQMELARTRAELSAAKRRETWLWAGADILARLLDAEDPRSVLDLVAERAREAAEADHCSLVLRHDDDTWQIDVSIGYLSDDVRHNRVQTEKRSVQAALAGETLLINEPLLSPGPITPRLMQFGALVYAPLASRAGRPVGTLVLANRIDGRKFDAEDARLAASFAGHAGIALALASAS